MTNAERDVLAERERQKIVEGWTEAHDDMHDCDELAFAAVCYALPEGKRQYHRRVDGAENGGRDATWTAPRLWPWDGEFKATPDNRRRELVKAGALILAEIERLDRAEDRK